jgi:hypothetical protein
MAADNKTLAQALRLQASALVAMAEVLERPSSKTEEHIFDADKLPPGAQSWRQVLEAGRRGELELTPIGRRRVVTADAWAKYIESKRRGPVAIKPSDESALAAMGVVLPMRKASGAR